MSVSDTGTGRLLIMCWKSVLLRKCLCSLYFLARKSVGNGSVPHRSWTIKYMSELHIFLIYNFKDNLVEFFFLLFTFSELLQTKLTEIWKEDQTLPEKERIWSCRSCNRFVTSQSDLVCRPSPALWGSVRASPELCEDPTRRTLWSSWLNDSWIYLILP